MTAIIITGHGQFASGIHSALTLISITRTISDAQAEYHAQHA